MSMKQDAELGALVRRWADKLSDSPKSFLANVQAAIAAQSANTGSEEVEEKPVAKVVSWTNGSYHRNYKLEWFRDVPEGTELFEKQKN